MKVLLTIVVLFVSVSLMAQRIQNNKMNFKVESVIVPVAITSSFMFHEIQLNNPNIDESATATFVITGALISTATVIISKKIRDKRKKKRSRFDLLAKLNN